MQKPYLHVEKEIIAIDGKTLRGSHDRKKGKKALHLVSAWAAGLRLQSRTNSICP